MARGRKGLIGSILEKIGRMLQSGGSGRSRGRRSGKGGMLRRLLK